MLPDTLAMRLFLSVGATVALVLQIIRFMLRRFRNFRSNENKRVIHEKHG